MASRDTIKRRAFKRKQKKAKEERDQKAKTGQVTSVALPSFRTYDGFAGLSPSGAVRDRSSPLTPRTLEARVQTDPRAIGSTSVKASTYATSYVTNDPHYGSWNGWTHPDFVREAPVRKEKDDLVRSIYQYLERIVDIVKPFFEEERRNYRDLGESYGIKPNSALSKCYDDLLQAYQTTGLAHKKLSNPEARKQYPKLRWIKNRKAEETRRQFYTVCDQVDVGNLRKYHGQIGSFVRTYGGSGAPRLLYSFKAEKYGWKGSSADHYLEPYRQLLDTVGKDYAEAFARVIPKTTR